MLKRVLVAVIAVPAVVLITLLAPAWAFACFVAAVCGVAAWELIHATAKLPLQLNIATAVAAALIPFGFLAGQLFGLQTLFLLAFLLLAILFFDAIRAYGSAEEIRYDDLAKALFAGILMPMMLSSMMIIRGFGAVGHGRIYAIMTIGLAFITDGGAYFVGVLMGRHRGITKVSEKKSVEGYIGGLVIGMLYTLAFGLILTNCMQISVHYLSLILTGLLGALVTEIGDLAFSLIKRQYGVKDYGNLLPGHGGMMDRFDSMVFCAPLVLLISMYLPCF